MINIFPSYEPTSYEECISYSCSNVYVHTGKACVRTVTESAIGKLTFFTFPFYTNHWCLVSITSLEFMSRNDWHGDPTPEPCLCWQLQDASQTLNNCHNVRWPHPPHFRTRSIFSHNILRAEQGFLGDRHECWVSHTCVCAPISKVWQSHLFFCSSLMAAH